MSDDDTRKALAQASTPPTKALFSTLITANHILHYQNVVDGFRIDPEYCIKAYGHISVRNPQDPNTFFLSKSLAPALVSGREDLQEYRVSDASPVGPEGVKGYAERFIHSEIYKKFKDVMSVVHSHSEAVVPFSVGSVPLRPVFHMGRVMGTTVPVYDITLHYKSSDTLHSLLVNNEHLGAALAGGMHPSTMLGKTASLVKNIVTSATTQDGDYPSCPTILMRGHGFTCVGSSIEDAVYRAIYTCTNARVQTTAVLLQGTYNVGLLAERFGAGENETGPAKQEEIKYLSEREIKDSSTAMKVNVDRPWQLWCAEVENSTLYQNKLGSQALV